MHENIAVMVNQSYPKKISLQALVVNACNGSKKSPVRVFLCKGSQGFYVLKSIAKEFELEVKGIEDISYNLFGSVKCNPSCKV